MCLREVRRVEAFDTHEVDPGAIASESGLVERPAAQIPEQGAWLEIDEADLLVKLATQGLLVGFSFLTATARSDPPVAVLVSVAEQQGAALLVHDHGTHVLAPGEAARAARELLEPAAALGPRHGGVRGRGGREDK